MDDGLKDHPCSVLCMYNLFQAGIKRRNLELAFEPEVAAVHCMHIPSENLSGRGKDLKEMSEPGRKFAVLDLGGNFFYTCTL